MSYGPFSTRELNPHVVYARDKDGSKIVEKTTFVNASVRTRELAAPASPAKFAGSGGAIVGIYRDETMYRELTTELGAIGSRVFKPQIR